MIDFWNRPCAAKGLTSYKYTTPHGIIMIGAVDTQDALSEAARSTTARVYLENLQVWNHNRYVKI